MVRVGLRGWGGCVSPNPGDEWGGDSGTAYLIAVPKQLLEEVGPDTSDPFLLSNYMHGNLGSGGETISCPVGMKIPIAIYL